MDTQSLPVYWIYPSLGDFALYQGGTEDCSEAMASQAIRSFIGVLRVGGNDLYVSSGGFSKEAH